MRCSVEACCHINQVMLWWCLDSSIWLGVGECHSISYPCQCVVPTPQEPNHMACYPQTLGRHPQFWGLGNAERCVLPSARCHSTFPCLSSSSLTGYISTLYSSWSGCRDWHVGSPQGNPEHHIPMAHQCNRLAERRRQGIFPSMAGKVVLVETPSL